MSKKADDNWFCADGERRYGDDEVGMADIKETIQGLYALKTYLASKTIEETIEENGPASESLIGMQKVVDSAVNLLKEQESEAKWIYGEDKTGVDGWHCSECDFFEPWFYEFTDDIDFIRFYGHCPNCGRKMTSYTGKPTKTGG